MPSVVMRSVVMFNVILLSVVAPHIQCDQMMGKKFGQILGKRSQTSRQAKKFKNAEIKA